jgi:hypothetical protein
MPSRSPGRRWSCGASRHNSPVIRDGCGPVGLKRAGFVQRLDATADRGRVRAGLRLLTAGERTNGLGPTRYSNQQLQVLKPGRWPLRGLPAAA